MRLSCKRLRPKCAKRKSRRCLLFWERNSGKCGIIAALAEITQAASKVPDRLLLALYQNRRGYPFVIPRALLPALMAMSRRQAINAFVDQFVNRHLLVPVTDPSIHDQISSPVDLVLAREKIDEA